MGRLKLYVAGSAVMANVVLMRAYYERPNFYSAAVYISQSTGSLMFLVNLMLIVAASFGYGLQRLFYGPLRPIETEQLYDKAWFAVSETLLAMTIFRDDIGIWFFTMFLCLLAGKVWQWIGEGRVEFLEQQPPANPKLFHIRLTSSLILSVAFDVFMMQYCIDSILSDARPGVMVMFGFEYVLLAIASISTLMRYTLSLVELFIIHRQEKAREEARRVAREQAQQRATADGTEALAEEDDDDDDDDDDGDVPGWEEKGRWVFYLDLATDGIKSVVYLGFFMILMTFYGIPIHIMRDLFMTIRSFLKRINDFVQYRNATRDMNTRYPDATAEELDRENTCIVCREEMRPWAPAGADAAQAGRRQDERQRPKKLPCGHILHASCLRSWLERQQVCPTCRRSVLAQPGTQSTQPNQRNNANQAQQPQVDLQGNNALQALLRGNLPLNNFPPPAGQAAQPNQPNQPAPPAAAAAAPPPPNAPRGNLRVFNFGPFRIALGNMQVGANDNVRNAIEQLRQQAAANTAAQAQLPQQPNIAQALAQLPQQAAPIPGAVPLHPHDIQSDILRIQQNIIESIRNLTLQHEQLEVLYRLLAELRRLQTESGNLGQELPPIASLNPRSTTHGVAEQFPPQAYLARGETLRQGDAGIPAGLTLPEGWTIRPMARVGQGPSQPASSARPSAEASQPHHQAADTALSNTAPTASASTNPQASSSAPPASGPSSSPKPAEPSSLESSWSFGNVPERHEAEGSSSAVASGSSGGNVSRRTATVEDAEDRGE